jgi:PTH1 family peptidyl-tRNA hydrolase
LRIKQGGGHGGHNGLRDIDRHMGKDYWRVRIGVGRPDINQDVDKWVLSDFSKQERSDWLSALIEAISAECPRLTEMDMATFASKVAWRAPAPTRQNETKQGDENGL